MSSSFTTANYFPSRRRAAQACVNCRNRKTRCDAAKPKCSLCSSQNVECVYTDSQQPRIDPNTLILLERIQLLEDRLLFSPAFHRPPSGTPLPAQTPEAQAVDLSGSVTAAEALTGNSNQLLETDLDLEAHIPLSHTASANHVYDWQIVQQLLSEVLDVQLERRHGESTNRKVQATDVFFEESFKDMEIKSPPESWRLLRDPSINPSNIDAVAFYHGLIQIYFRTVNIFFPLLSKNDVLNILEKVIDADQDTVEGRPSVQASSYCLLLIVLSLAAFVDAGGTTIYLKPASESNETATYGFLGSALDEKLWDKSKLLFGHIQSHLTIEAAQCSMLASVYTGAKGQISDSFHWAHTAAVKCEALARRAMISISSQNPFPDAFCRVYWVSLIFESDFVSEISINSPSGIAKFEDHIPYPAFESLWDQTIAPERNTDANFEPEEDHTSTRRADELAAFQISTNAAIRRFLNRVNAVVYNRKEQYRLTKANYATWLLRVTEELWSHHAAIYRNLPDFLLTSEPRKADRHPTSPATAISPTPGNIRAEDQGNNPWNVSRLKGRYYAAQYIIHRPFVEYVLLNMAPLDTHPCKATILEKCRLCLDGCMGFIKVFDVDPANSTTCLFATGMVTFTMVILLRISTVCQAFRVILPEDIEHGIIIGKRNLRRFSENVKEFSWHLQELERLDTACHSRMDTNET